MEKTESYYIELNLYNGKNPFEVQGQMLHSYRLEFKHPVTGKILKLEAKLPKYFQDVLDKLDKEG